jgi:phosphohistidine swiveling domain-containing protein
MRVLFRKKRPCFGSSRTCWHSSFTHSLIPMPRSRSLPRDFRHPPGQRPVKSYLMRTGPNLREETKPEDIHGFFAAQGILTSRGGKTSHAAVVARSMGKPCVSGCEAIQINPISKEALISGVSLREGDMITIDGTTGNIYQGKVPTIEPEFVEDLCCWSGLMKSAIFR